jgi:L,D-transpeptidase YbiS
VPRIRVSIPAQTLTLADDAGGPLRCYAVSTASNGAGERRGSHCTPRGRHVVRAKIWTPTLAAQYPGRDWILTRILWLSGCVPGFNRLGEVDTMRRYIYIHGSPDAVPMGVPGSIGCVRMRNVDIIELFDLVPARTPVEILGDE